MPATADTRGSRTGPRRRRSDQLTGRLYVSVKAVEYHLSNAYPKLGISSRRQLGAALAKPLEAD